MKLHHTLLDAVPQIGVKWKGADFPNPEILYLNRPLASEIGVSLDELQNKDMIALFTGHGQNSQQLSAYALGYSGYQFGHFNPQLGDGRALLIGEVLTPENQYIDLHLKGSGITPFSRGGDGKAILSAVLREYLIGEALSALGIATTRALAVLTTGEDIYREGYKPGAVLVRSAASHIRVGSFQYFMMRQDMESLKALLKYSIDRHYPELKESTSPAEDFLKSVCEKQAKLIAKWMAVGFIHGVMNTDNVAISGEAIDFGPCAFIDYFAMDKVHSSIDTHGRYAYGNQPRIGAWNMARFAECLLPLLHSEQNKAVEIASQIIADFIPKVEKYWSEMMLKKIGLWGLTSAQDEGIQALLKDLTHLLEENNLDYTLFFRDLSQLVYQSETDKELKNLSKKQIDWCKEYFLRLPNDAEKRKIIANEMDQINPLYIPRNHKVKGALDKADEGDFSNFEDLLTLVQKPFTLQQGAEEYARPPAVDAPHFVSYCGT